MNRVANIALGSLAGSYVRGILSLSISDNAKYRHYRHNPGKAPPSPRADREGVFVLWWIIRYWLKIEPLIN